MSNDEIYEIRVEGRLGTSWQRWFEELTARFDNSGETVLVGRIPDQAALYGVLAKIRDLNLKLVSINRMNSRIGSRKGDRPPS